MKNLVFDADALMEAVAPLLGLTIDATSREAVKTHLEIAVRSATLLDEAELSDREEPAPVYAP
jgi:hypothetical protein